MKHWFTLVLIISKFLRATNFSVRQQTFQDKNDCEKLLELTIVMEIMVYDDRNPADYFFMVKDAEELSFW